VFERDCSKEAVVVNAMGRSIFGAVFGWWCAQLLLKLMRPARHSLRPTLLY